MQLKVFSENDPILSSLDTFHDEKGLIRLKSRILNRNDSNTFRFPIVLPSKDPIAKKLIYDKHIKLCHVRAQGL